MAARTPASAPLIVSRIASSELFPLAELTPMVMRSLSPAWRVIVPSVTRAWPDAASPLLLTLLAEARPVTLQELIEGIGSGDVTEVFGAGTAAVISLVGKIGYAGEDYVVNDHETGYWARQFFDTLTGIQYGELEDKHEWVYKVL